MIEYHYKLDFSLKKEDQYTSWLVSVVESEKRSVNQINYIYCSDDYLVDLNVKYLNHNTLTDILTFDYSEGEDIVADVFISVERVKDNAKDFGIDFDSEMLRVMAHGVLHIIGYQDKSEDDILQMRLKEDEKIKMFHVEQ